MFTLMIWCMIISETVRGRGEVEKLRGWGERGLEGKRVRGWGERGRRG